MFFIFLYFHIGDDDDDDDDNDDDLFFVVWVFFSILTFIIFTN